MRTEPMTDEQIRAIAPSVFATEQYGAMSSKYAFIPTSNIVTAMRQNGFAPVYAQQSRTRIANKQFFTKHLIRFRSQQQLTHIGQRLLEMELVNSHDGSSVYSLSFGILELRCLNGLTVADGTVGSIHVKHMGNIVDSALNGSFSLLEHAPKVDQTIDLWKQITLNPAEQLDFATAAKSLRYAPNSNMFQAVEPQQLLTARRYEDRRDDLWTVFNKVQENTVRGGLRAAERVNGRRATTREVTGIDQNVKLNKQLWSLAENAAALKLGTTTN